MSAAPDVVLTLKFRRRIDYLGFGVGGRLRVRGKN
jgi:hypothetical protein